MQIIKHVWFDFAGTLYRETPDFKKVHDVFRYQKYAELTGTSDLAIAEAEYLKLYDKYGSNSATFEALGQPSDYWMKALEDIDFTKIVTPDQVVSETLRAISSKLPISLFSNFPQASIRELLDHLLIPASTFTNILGGDEVANRKPALDGFYKIVELSNLPPEQILYVGDRPDVDIKPAKKVGLQTCLVYAKSEEADYSFEDFSDVLTIVTS